MKKVGVGIVGCGSISGIYFKNIARFRILETVACSDLEPAKAESRADEYGVPRVVPAGEITSDPEVEIILNLTPPPAHAGVCLAALEAGKHVYTEKPLAVECREGEEIIRTAEQARLRVGCAPDTFLGGAFQDCRRLISEGHIGKPTGACAFMTCHGHERWHPAPAFYYRAGGGPMFDMGPYYLAVLVSLLGPVAKVGGMCNAALAERIIGSGADRGKKIRVEVPTHVAGLLEFRAGAVGMIMTSFDVWKSNLPRIEIYGTEGVLELPDPNNFGGRVRIFRAGAEDWEEIPPGYGFTENMRGLGLADMAHAMKSGRAHRADGRLGLHVLRVMHALHDSSREGAFLEIPGDCPVPAPLPPDLPDDALED